MMQTSCKTRSKQQRSRVDVHFFILNWAVQLFHNFRTRRASPQSHQCWELKSWATRRLNRNKKMIYLRCHTLQSAGRNRRRVDGGRSCKGSDSCLARIPLQPNPDRWRQTFEETEGIQHFNGPSSRNGEKRKEEPTAADEPRPRSWKLQGCFLDSWHFPKATCPLSFLNPSSIQHIGFSFCHRQIWASFRSHKRGVRFIIST